MISEFDICEYLFHISPKKNIIPIKGIYETFEKLYVIMEYFKRGNLDKMISENYNSLTNQTKYDYCFAIDKRNIFSPST